MSKSEIEGLPKSEELSKVLLEYITPLYKSISVLLRSADEDEDEFERNFKNVTFEFYRYSTSILMALTEEHIAILVNYWTHFSRAGNVPAQTPISQALADASEIIANFIWLTVEPNYRNLVQKHPGVFIPYSNLLVYSAILIYILHNHSTNDVKPSMVEKIIRKTQETTSTVEGYVDTIEILADPEASAALERIRQTPL
jgi:hypothetical protein